MDEKWQLVLKHLFCLTQGNYGAQFDIEKMPGVEDPATAAELLIKYVCL